MASDGGLRPLFRKHIQADWQSIETATTGGGVPDSNFCADGVEGWVEFKQTSGWAVTLRPEQVGWILRRVRNGGRVFIAVRRWKEGVDDLWLLRGEYARELKDCGLRKCPSEAILGRWMNGPSHWDWNTVRAMLLAESERDVVHTLGRTSDVPSVGVI